MRNSALTEPGTLHSHDPDPPRAPVESEGLRPTSKGPAAMPHPKRVSTAEEHKTKGFRWILGITVIYIDLCYLTPNLTSLMALGCY